MLQVPGSRFHVGFQVPTSALGLKFRKPATQPGTRNVEPNLTPGTWNLELDPYPNCLSAISPMYGSLYCSPLSALAMRNTHNTRTPIRNGTYRIQPMMGVAVRIRCSTSTPRNVIVDCMA